MTLPIVPNSPPNTHTNLIDDTINMGPSDFDIPVIMNAQDETIPPIPQPLSSNLTSSNLTSTSVNTGTNKLLSADGLTPVDGNLDERLTFGKRLLDMLLVGVLFGFFGLVIDWVVNIIKNLNNTHGSQMAWFFVYFMGGLGLILGWLMGVKALDVVFGLFRTTATDHPSNDEDIFSSGIMRAIGFGLLIGIVGWLLMMLMA